MDIKTYIESGILENYILGTLSEQEANDVQKMLVQYPEVQAELDTIESTLADYAQMHAIEPPANLKANILQSIENLNTPEAPAPVVQNNHWRILAACIGVLMLIKLATILYFYQKNETLQANATAQQAQVTTLQTELSTLQTDCDDIRKRVRILEEKIAILRDEYNQSIIMKGTQNAPEAVAQVHWNPKNAIAYLDLVQMPKPPSGKQYQLWALKNNQPTSMGTINLDIEPGEFLQVAFVKEVDAFAISLEDEGGKQSPDMSAIQTVGEI